MFRDAASCPHGRCDKTTEECGDLMYHLPASAPGNLGVGFGGSLILSGAVSTGNCQNDSGADVSLGNEMPCPVGLLFITLPLNANSSCPELRSPFSYNCY